MDWKMVESQESLDQVLGSFEWFDAFIREGYFVCPSYIIPEGRATNNPDAVPSMKLLVTSPSETNPALELLFVGVEDLSIWFGGRELAPSAIWNKHQVAWSFHREKQPPIRAQKLYFRFLDNSSWGNNLRYGCEEIFDDSGRLITI